jgi:ketosteroid isomerase-like protein
MQRVMIAVVLVLMSAGLALAAETPEQAAVMKTVNQFVDGFNKADSNTMLTACADQTSIVDAFPPHTWQSCSAWWNDYNAWAKKGGVTDGTVPLGAPKHVDITGDRAYVDVPASFAYKQNGKPMKETGSMWTLVLQKEGTGWRIVAWTWSAGQ